ncbi:MAG: adenylate/guanylate cyclase domain-containing protein [Proteobacteria bacterium]|nr:adenylate/guanylate cyclase domain-containing protein [Pseudomonadota bacterium]
MGSEDMSSKTVFRAFVITDIVGSTDLKQRMGDAAYAEALARHDELFQSCLAEFGGTEPKDIGDGFLASFDVPSNAVRCSLRFQKGLVGLRTVEPLKVRIGVHVGEIVLLAGIRAEVK